MKPPYFAEFNLYSSLSNKHSVAVALKIAYETLLIYFLIGRHDDAQQQGSRLRSSVFVSGFKAPTVWEPLDFLCVLF